MSAANCDEMKNKDSEFKKRFLDVEESFHTLKGHKSIKAIDAFVVACLDQWDFTDEQAEAAFALAVNTYKVPNLHNHRYKMAK